jgi:hypothetical protein
MAYRIKVHAIVGHTHTISNAVGALMAAVHRAVEDAGFKVGDYDYVGSANARGPKDGSRKPGYIVDMRKIRLARPKPYCGNHPGECVAAGRRTKAGLKPASACLEWDDWVRFHDVVNDVLDQYHVDADITTAGADVDHGRLLFCRRGMQRRLRYDWVETARTSFNATRPVNYGTQDQFEVSP